MANEFKVKKGLIVTGGDGGTVLDVQGSQGQLFSVTDDLSGSIFAVSDISGVPILDVNSSGVSYFDGKLGIGTANPSRQLEVVSSSGIVTVLTSTTGGSYISMEDSATTSDSQVRFGAIGDNAIIKSGGTTTLSLDASQNAIFAGDVSGVAGTFTGNLAVGNASAAEIYLNRNSANYINASNAAGYLVFRTGGTTTALTLNATGAGTFGTQAFATTATSSGDDSSTLTTKGYVDSLITGATIYRGAWDPSGGGYGSPDLSGVTQTSGYYYICSAAGTAEPNGTGTEPDTWDTGDWVIYNDVSGTGQWQKIDNSSVLSGVGTGQTVALWEGAGSVTDSETLGNAPITVSGNNTTFAGEVNAGTGLRMYTDGSGNGVIYNLGQDKDLYFVGDDGGTGINALVFDMSEGGNATFAGDVTAADLLTVNGDGHLFLGADGETPKIDMMYDDHASGLGWDTRIFIGKTDDLPNGQSFPTSTIAGGFGTQYQANSDGAFFGIIPYATGNYRPVINWGDDAADSPFSFQFNGTNVVNIDVSGNVGGNSFTGDHIGTINTATTGVTQTAGNNSTLIATTAYADAAAAAVDPSGVYLPLTAGSGSSLTDNLYINDVDQNNVNRYGNLQSEVGFTRSPIAGNPNQWFKVVEMGGSPKRIKFSIIATGDNTNSYDNFLISTSGYGMNMHIQKLPGGRYNTSKLLAVSVVNPSNGGSVEIWIKLLPVSSGTGVTYVACTSDVLASATILASATTTDPYTGGNDTQLDISGDNRNHATIQTSRGATFGAKVGIGTNAPSAMLTVAGGDATISGNVGIGTTDTSRRLSVFGSNTSFATTEIPATIATVVSNQMTDNNYHSILQLVAVRASLTSGQNSNGYLGFSTMDDSNNQGVRDAGRIAIVNENGGARNSPTALTFWTNTPGGNFNTTPATEKMRITSAGSVGIGNTNPQAKMHIGASLNTMPSNTSIAMNGGTTLRFTGGGDGNSDYGSYIAGVTVGSIRTLQLGSRNLSTDELAMTLSQGNVGIGTTTPLAKLDIQGTQGQLFSVTDDLSGDIFSVADISGVPIMNVNSDGTSYLDGKVYINATASIPNRTEEFQVTGRQIITNTGTDGPSLYLGYNSSGSNTIQLGRGRTADGLSYIDLNGEVMAAGDYGFRIMRNAGVNAVTMLNQVGTGNLQINAANGADTVFTNTNVGIGITGPGNKLTVATAQGTTFSDAFLGLKATATTDTTGRTAISLATSTVNNFGVTLNGIRQGSTSGEPRFGIKMHNNSSGGLEALSIRSSGNVGIGTMSPNSTLEVNGTLNTGNTNGGVWLRESGSKGEILGLNNDGTAYSDLSIRSASGTQLYLDTNGNVGIGTTNPAQKLVVNTNATAGSANLSNIDKTSGNLVRFTNPQYSADASMGILLRAFPDSDVRQGAGIIATGGGTNERTNLSLFVSTDGAGTSSLSYAALTAIGLTGNVGIGVTSPGTKLHVNQGNVSGTVIKASGIQAQIEIETSTAGDAHLYMRPNSTGNNAAIFKMTAGTNYNWRWQDDATTPVVFMQLSQSNSSLSVKGDIIAYGSPSDERYKENIKPIESALDKVTKLQGVTFDWKESDNLLDIKEDIGFIAQDVQKVVPELVRENEDGKLSLRYQGITPILLEAIKELKAEIDLLKSKPCNCNKCNCNI